MTCPWAAKTDPSYGFPEPHSYESPCIHTITAYGASTPVFPEKNT